MSVSVNNKSILCVGLVCLDIINVTNEFPTEDSDTRCLDQRCQRGGNASNNCTVFSLLGNECELLVSIASNPQLISFQFLERDMMRYNIKLDHCRLYDQKYDNPMSMVIINENKGTRTILHHRGLLPELELKDFDSLDLTDYKWIHFEARNHIEYAKMMKLINEWNSEHNPDSRISMSVEVEKVKPGLQDLILLGDLVFISKDVSQAYGHESKEKAAATFAKQLKIGATVVCPWGQCVVAACTVTDNCKFLMMSESAFIPECVKDTLGAGDAFIASTIHALLKGEPMTNALRFGCRVAGEKCAFHGFDNIALLTLHD